MQQEAAALGPKLAPFTPSGDGVLDHALDLLALTVDDVLFDLGCGDARLLVHAAEKSGVRWGALSMPSEWIAISLSCYHHR